MTVNTPGPETPDLFSPTLPGVVARLRAAGCVFAEDEAALLLDAALDDEQLEAMVVRRVEGYPLEQIVGWAEFAGLRIIVEPDVFVPRQRTVFLVELAAAAAPADAVVVDLCCGSGAVGAALKVADPGITLYAADIQPAAVACARLNLDGIGEVFEGDLFGALPGALRGTIDILTCNAPYVPTDEIRLMPPEARLYEPTITLDGGVDGLDLHRRVASEARSWLAPGGSLFIETSELQAESTAAAMTEHGLVPRIEHDDERGGTVVVGTREN
jgi:release factor glutamine methyltransferase